MQKQLLKILQLCIFLGIGFFLVWWVFSRFTEQEKQSALNALQNADYKWLVISLCMAIASHTSRAMRWQMLIQPITHTTPPLKTLLPAVLVAYLANLAFPRLGEVSRCGIVNRYQKIPMQQLIGTVITERLIDVVSLIIVTTLAILLQINTLGSFFAQKIGTPLLQKLQSFITPTQLLPKIILLAILGISTFFAYRYFKNHHFYEKIKNILVGVKQGVMSVRYVQNLPLFVFHSAFIWLMYAGMIYFCFYTMPATQHLGASHALAVLSLGSFAMIATQGGIGAYQLFVANLLILYGITYELGYAFGWLAWGAQAFFVLLTGFASLILLPILHSSPVLPITPKTDTPKYEQ